MFIIRVIYSDGRNDYCCQVRKVTAPRRAKELAMNPDVYKVQVIDVSDPALEITKEDIK